ncbi:MAG: SAM-dependent methyltransferase [Phycisphaeraceae bacterium]|nr:SAM-dependent methyltransferase [Phycisphaeraceae bacterium]
MGMNETTTSQIYDLWSRIYDRTFGALVDHRYHRALEQMQLKSGDRVLDIGVGTGLMLRCYRQDVTVVGIDLSAGMLAKAARKCREDHLSHCQLVRGDAMMPPFPDRTFDHVMVSHALTVVSDPARLLDWAGRLVRPGGRIVLSNHFQSTYRVIASLEKLLNPLFMKIGWRSDLALEDVLDGVDLEVDYSFRLQLLDVWQIVVLRRATPSSIKNQANIEPTVTGTPLAMGNH